ncbi:3,4-dihydroxy-2-butanone-4-phosphate synthase [Vulcanisaeta sp. JCM 16161]|uniref:3,4-dihydroxy-2-butanone-4-phosphate synthase n=1 Tax=Vulcanisaeta sp. JCM 16161 TaxID=1295372 RepID=UPI00406D1B23
MIEKALELLRRGKIIFIHDSDERENEVDAVIRADYVTPSVITWMRKNAGGLICFVTEDSIGRQLGLDFMSDVLRKVGFNGLVKRPGYGDDPAFSIYVNHVKTATGIRDRDRALTITRLADVVKMIGEGRVMEARKVFYEEFYAPGHVPILLGRIGRRFGHTELSLMLSRMAGVPPALVIVEMLSDDGGALSKDIVGKIANELGTALISGSEIISEAKRQGII